MNERMPPEGTFPDRTQAEQDHWEIYAEAMDLTIEGHRLIAQEIVYEVKALWRTVLGWLPRVKIQWRSSPPA